MKKLIIGFAMAAIMASCGATGAATNTSKIGKAQMTLANTQWVLSDANVQGKTPTLVIEDGKISGNAGCNRYFGTLMTDSAAGNFGASQIGSTRMMCDNIQSESNFLKLLGEANKYVVSGNTLELYRNNLLLLKFAKQ